MGNLITEKQKRREPEESDQLSFYHMLHPFYLGINWFSFSERYPEGQIILYNPPPPHTHTQHTPSPPPPPHTQPPITPLAAQTSRHIDYDDRSDKTITTALDDLSRLCNWMAQKAI